MIRLIYAVLISALCATAQATPQQLLTNFQQMRLSATSATTNFYMFSGLDADRRYEQRLDQSMKRFQEALNSAEKLAPNSDMQAEIVDINKQWLQFSSLIKTNRSDMLKQGFPNIRLVDEMGNTSNAIVALATTARDKLMQKSGIEPNKVVSQARELALLMERITSQYAARGTSNLGQVFVGSSEQSLNEMAEQFSKELALLVTLAKSPKTDPLLHSIQSKWRFMEERIRNYNENTVVFLVVSYNDRIIEHLQELEGMYL